MVVAVVGIAGVRMRVHEPLVIVRMAVRFRRIDAGWVHVLMVSVVHVKVFVIHRRVLVPVLVAIGDEDEYADGHRGRSRDVNHVPPLAEQRDRQYMPANGAVAKIAASRAAPRIRSA